MAPRIVSLSDVYPLRSRYPNEFTEDTVMSDKRF